MKWMAQPFKGPRIFIDPKEIALKERLENLDEVIAFLQEIREQIVEQLDHKNA
jgi:hypothetical protein